MLTYHVYAPLFRFLRILPSNKNPHFWTGHYLSSGGSQRIRWHLPPTAHDFTILFTLPNRFCSGKVEGTCSPWLATGNIEKGLPTPEMIPDLHLRFDRKRKYMLY
jgi:hypothetical protein